MNRLYRLIGNDRGKSRLKALVIIIIVAAIGYTVIKFVPPYVMYLKLKNAAYDSVNAVGHKGTDAVLIRFMKMAKDAGSDVTTDNVTVVKDESTPMTITVDYSTTVVLVKDKLEKVLTFHIEESLQ